MRGASTKEPTSLSVRPFHGGGTGLKARAFLPSITLGCVEVFWGVLHIYKSPYPRASSAAAISFALSAAVKLHAHTHSKGTTCPRVRA